jgi:hypothetical protein
VGSTVLDWEIWVGALERWAVPPPPMRRRNREFYFSFSKSKSKEWAPLEGPPPARHRLPLETPAVSWSLFSSRTRPTAWIVGNHEERHTIPNVRTLRVPCSNFLQLLIAPCHITEAAAAEADIGTSRALAKCDEVGCVHGPVHRELFLVKCSAGE